MLLNLFFDVSFIFSAQAISSQLAPPILFNFFSPLPVFQLISFLSDARLCKFITAAAQSWESVYSPHCF